MVPSANGVLGAGVWLHCIHTPHTPVHTHTYINTNTHHTPHTTHRLMHMHIPHTCTYKHTAHATHMQTRTHHTYYIHVHRHPHTHAHTYFHIYAHTHNTHIFPQERIAILGCAREPETHKTVITGNDCIRSYADSVPYLPNYSALEIFLFKATRRVLP